VNFILNDSLQIMGRTHSFNISMPFYI